MVAMKASVVMFCVKNLASQPFRNEEYQLLPRHQHDNREVYTFCCDDVKLDVYKNRFSIPHCHGLSKSASE